MKEHTLWVGIAAFWLLLAATAVTLGLCLLIWTLIEAF